LILSYVMNCLHKWILGRNNVEDMSVVEMFLQEVGLDEGLKDEIVAIIKGMGEIFSYSVICVYAYVLHFCSTTDFFGGTV